MKVVGVPAEQQVGQLRVALTLGPIARMFAAEDWLRVENAGGGAVFAGRTGEVIENVDEEPAAGQVPRGLFNLDAHIHDIGSGHPVPYLQVRVTVARHGEAVLADVPLVPVARPSKGTAGLHYGNNVALEPSGGYQVAVTVEPGALTGTDSTQRLEFDVAFD